MPTPDVLADYDRWLHAVATSIGRPVDHDDLVQEGRVAMWRALETFDEARGSLPSWLTRAAETRMRDVAWGRGQPFGHEAVRGSRQVEETTSVDAWSEDEAEERMGYTEPQEADNEILEAVLALPEAQREYVFLRFWGGLDPTSRAPEIRALVARFPALGDRWQWRVAQRTLRESLAAYAA